jgi:uncharacterized repeat protein (TIGR01451 family)
MFIPTRYAFAGSVLCCVLFTSALLASPAAAQINRDFTPRFVANVNGDFAYAANTVLTCDNDADPTNGSLDASASAADRECEDVIAGANPTPIRNDEPRNNRFFLRNLDADSDPNTFNSSGALLDIPAGASILWAGLYWGTRSAGNGSFPSGQTLDRENVKFDLPGGGTNYISVDAQQVDDVASGLDGYFAEVTALVQQGGGGVYMVADVDAVEQNNGYAAWTLVVAYEDPSEPFRNLSVFDGNAGVQENSGSAPDEITVTPTGFTTPLMGNFDPYVGVVLYDGDKGKPGQGQGDFFAVNGTDLANAANPVDDFGNASISFFGNQPVSNVPAYTNVFSTDVDVLFARDPNTGANLINNGDSSADVTLGGGQGERVNLQVLTFASEIYQPDVSIDKTLRDINGGQVEAGDFIEYTIVVENTGQDEGLEAVIMDNIPVNTTYVPGTLEVLYGPNLGPKSDSQGNDQAEYVSADDKVVFRIGTNADGTNGGMLMQDVPTAVRFQVQIDAGVADGTTILNQAILSYRKATLGTMDILTSAAATNVVGVGTDLVVEKSDDVDPVIAGDTFTYTIDAHNDGPDPASDVTVRDVIPAGTEFVSAAVTSGAGWTPVTPAVGSTGQPVSFNKSGAFAVSESAQFTITVRTDASLADGFVVNNSARILSTTVDINASNNEDTEPTTVLGLADLSLEKTASPSRVALGSNVTYTLTLANGGPNDATGVTVADALPAGLTFVSATPSAGSYDAATGLWTVGTVADAGSETLTLVARVDDIGGLTNTAEVASSDQPDPDSTPSDDDGDQSQDDEAKATVEGVQVDLAVTKVVDDPMPLVGSTVTFTVVVQNSGPSTATGVELTDQLPAGLAFVASRAGQGTYSSATGVWNVGSLAVGASAQLEIDATVTGVGPYENVAEVTAAGEPDADSTPANGDPTEDDQASALVGGGQIDLSLQKQVMPATVAAGGTASFTLTLRNDGSVDATGVEVEDVLPAGLTLVSANPAPEYDAGTGVWTVGTVPAGHSATLVLHVQTALDGTFDNVAQVSAANEPDADSFPGDNVAADDDQDNALLTVTPVVDLRLSKTVSSTAPVLGSTVTYTLEVTNDGPSDATGVAVTDPFTIGLDYQSDNGGGAYDDATGVWTVGALASGATASIEIVAQVSQPGTLTNTAQVTAADQPDADSTPGNGDATEDDQASASVGGTQIDLSLGKTASASAVNVGSDVTFTLTLTNGGTTGATGVEVTDALPAGLTFVSANPAIDYNDATGVWTVGSVAVGETKTLEIVATVAGVGPFSNSAEVSAANEPDVDSAPGNGDAGEDDQSHAVVSGLLADLSLVKNVSPGSATVGEVITYEVLVTNDGPSPSLGAGVSVGDQLPAGVSVLMVAESRGSYDVATGVWTLGMLGVGETASLLVEVVVTAAGALVNTAEVIGADSPDPDSTPNNNDPAEDDQDSATIGAVPQSADLSLVKTVDDPTPSVGDVVTFTITLTNAGPGAASGVEVTDQLPAGLTFVAARPSHGGYSDADGRWAVGALASGAAATLEIDAEVAASAAARNVAEVTASDNPDPDSQPGNDDGDQSQDDEDFAVVSPGSSGGGGGGIESDGGMAVSLNQRLFERRTDAFTQQVLRAAPAPVVFAESATASTLGGRSKQAGFDLARIAPPVGPMDAPAYVVTPEDILGITNATSVFSADYVRHDGARLGAFFATTSQTDLYDHTKQTCDRLAGGRLQLVTTAKVAGRPFILSELHQASGAVDFAITFVAYRTGSAFAVDSRFVPDAYEVPGGVDEIVNVQVWAASPEYAVMLAESALARLGGEGSVSYLNDARAAPAVYVRGGRYEGGVLTLEVVNATGEAQSLRFEGSAAPTETEAQANARTPLSETVSLPAPSGGDIATEVALPVGMLYDVAFTLEMDGAVVDRSYAADGTWGTNVGAGEITTFEVVAQAEPAEADAARYPLARAAYAQGRTSDYAALFRSLRPAWQPVDLTGMTHLEATLSGSGSMQVVVEKASVEGGQQYGAAVELSATPRAVRIALADLTNASGQRGFEPTDVTAVVFYASGSGTAKPFTIVAQDLAFTGRQSVASEGASEVPGAAAISTAYPNPFGARTVIGYAVPASAPVRLAVYDVLGREVRVLVDSAVEAGWHEATFDAGDLAAGTYLVRLETGDRSATRIITLVR